MFLQIGFLVTAYNIKNLQYNTVGQWVDGMIFLRSDGQMLILIDWE